MQAVIRSSAAILARGLRALPVALFFLLVLLFHGLSEAALRPTVVDAPTVRGAAVADAQEGVLRFTSAAGATVRLRISPDPDEILNPAYDGTLHPFARDTVEQALRGIAPLRGDDLAVRFYCLPGLPVDVGGSFCVGNEIFLSPALAPGPTSVVASTVVHELGHVVHNLRLEPRGGRGWDLYRRLRELDPQIHHATASHRNRPREIFAEDFRRLFGGPQADYSGSHENHDLADPAGVDGLREFFEGVLAGAYQSRGPLARVSNHPNPFNPRTTIVVQLRPEQVVLGGSVRVDVFDVRGRRVRSLGERPVAETLRISWDGTDDRGRRIASGRYSYRVQVEGESVVGPMTLLQ